MNHIVLAGDSIFDNSAYTRGGADVITHLQGQIPTGWRATLLAVDGSCIEHVEAQMHHLPDDASHVIVSAGGNDALANSDILKQEAKWSSEVLFTLADRASAFEARYCKMLNTLLELRRKIGVCTIYYPRMEVPSDQKAAVAALTVFNDVIIKQAFLAGVPLIDLRLVCNEPEDYANEIEPSERGGSKIAAAIVQLVTDHNFEIGRTQVFI
jgi:GDSL-like Lipase/Acylhydrolase family